MQDVLKRFQPPCRPQSRNSVFSNSPTDRSPHPPRNRLQNRIHSCHTLVNLVGPDIFFSGKGVPRSSGSQKRYPPEWFHRCSAASPFPTRPTFRTTPPRPLWGVGSTSNFVISGINNSCRCGNRVSAVLSSQACPGVPKLLAKPIHSRTMARSGHSPTIRSAWSLIPSGTSDTMTCPYPSSSASTSSLDIE